MVFVNKVSKKIRLATWDYKTDLNQRHYRKMTIREAFNLAEIAL